jgi:hypothetical protein
MKKLSLILATASLTASLGAFAAQPTDAAPFQVVVPNLKSGVDITLEGLYLQPSNSDLDYATVASADTVFNADGTVSTTTHSSQVQTVDPDYNFGFRVGLGYTFADSGNDVQLSWTRFNHADSDSTNTVDGDVLTTPAGSFINNSEAVDYNTIKYFVLSGNPDDVLFAPYDDVTTNSETKIKLDAIDLDVGQYLDIGTRMRMRLFAGLRFARVQNDQTTTVNANGSYADWNDQSEEANYSTSEVTNFNSTFTGIGPRIGVNTSYHIGNGFGVVAQASAALLVGKVDSNTTSTRIDSADYAEAWEEGNSENDFFQDYSESGNKTVTTNNNVDSDNVNRVVPAMDAKLGLDYTHAFANESVLTVEAGYQTTQYIDAVDRFNLDGSRTTSSIGFSGPYLSLNLKV